MATINKRGDYQFQAIVRRKGYPAQTKTFESIKAARGCVTEIEAEMNSGRFVERSDAKKTTLGEVLTRYEREVTPLKRG
jgi:hypothetical protein